MKTLSIVIPVYFNKESLEILLNRLFNVEKELIPRETRLEIIFVDDGSGDGSFNELMRLKKLHPSIKIIKLTRNFGAVHASKTGCRYVTGDCFTILPADLQDPPELLLEMIDKWRTGEKFIICTRSSRSDPLISKFFSGIYYRLLRVFVDANYPKGGFDLALMDKSLLPYLVGSSKNVYTPLYMYWLGFKPLVIQYNREKRLHGKSKWTFIKKLNAGIDALLGFSILPIRIISLIGFVVSTLSLVYGSVIVINTILGKSVLPGFPTIVTLISFFSGLIIIMLGIIGEYLWRTFDEVNPRPESVIDEIY